MPRSERNDAWIVSQQDSGSIARNAAHSTPHVSAIAVVVHAGYIQGCAAKLHCNMLITKDFYAMPPQRHSYGIGPHPEIVISEDRKHTVSRPQAAQDLSRRFNIRARVGDEVSGEYNDIRSKAVRLLHGLGKPLLGQEQPVMNVRNLHYAQAAERFGEGIKPDALIVHSKAFARRPSHAAGNRFTRRVVLDSAAAPTAHPTGEPLSKARAFRY